MLRSRFESVPSAFSERLVPGSKAESSSNQVVLLMLKSYLSRFGGISTEILLIVVVSRSLFNLNVLSNNQ